MQKIMWFDPLFLVIKGMQDKQMQVLECIQDDLSDMGLNTTGGLSNNSNGMPKTHPSDYGLRYGSYGYDVWSDFRNR